MGPNKISCRIGRTGRVGNDGRAFSFIDWTDDGKIQVTYLDEKVMEKWKDTGVAFQIWRKKRLLNYNIPPQKDLVRILKQSGQIVPDFLKPLPDGTYKGNKTPRVNKNLPELSVPI